MYVNTSLIFNFPYQQKARSIVNVLCRCLASEKMTYENMMLKNDIFKKE